MAFILSIVKIVQKCRGYVGIAQIGHRPGEASTSSRPSPQFVQALGSEKQTMQNAQKMTKFRNLILKLKLKHCIIGANNEASKLIHELGGFYRMTLCATRGLPLYVGMYSADARFCRDDMLQHISLIVQAPLDSGDRIYPV